MNLVGVFSLGAHAHSHGGEQDHGHSKGHAHAHAEHKDPKEHKHAHDEHIQVAGEEEEFQHSNANMRGIFSYAILSFPYWLFFFPFLTRNHGCGNLQNDRG